MNTNLLIGLIISVAVVGGGGYIAYTSMQAESEVSLEEEVQEEQQQTQEENDRSLRGTFASLLGLGQNLRCTFSHNDGENVSSGVVYIAEGGERLRGDFSVEASASGSMDGHLVRNGGYSYLWGSSFDQGLKIEIEEGEEDELFSSDNDSMSVPIDENTQYECAPWNVDASMFAVPTDIEFMDLGAQLESMMQLQGGIDASAGLGAGQCGACEQIPDASAKAQCRAALGCQ